MDSRIGVGIIIGIIIGTTSLIWKSENFTYSQKVFLTICFLFPPAQWILAILIYFFNTSNLSSLKFNLQSSSKNSNPQNKSEKPKISIDEQRQSIQILKDKGVLTESEYQEKIDIIDEQIKTEKVYKSAEYLNLKSLYENEVFTKEEFENKIEFLKTKELVDNNLNQLNIVRDKLIGTWKDNIGTIEFWDDDSFIFKDKNQDITDGTWNIKNSDTVEIKFDSKVDIFTILELEDETFSYEHNNAQFTLIKQQLKNELLFQYNG